MIPAAATAAPVMMIGVVTRTAGVSNNGSEGMRIRASASRSDQSDNNLASGDSSSDDDGARGSVGNSQATVIAKVPL